MIPVLFFLFFSTSFPNPSWEGVWRLVAEGENPEIYHLFVRSSQELELYDQHFYPLDILEAHFGEDGFEVRAVKEGIADRLVFRLEGRGPSVHGSLTYAGRLVQYQVRQSLAGRHVLNRVPEALLKWWAEQGDKSLNLLERIAGRAPSGDFQSFARFWNEEIEPEYYFFLEGFLYGSDNQPGRKEKVLKTLFSVLPQLKGAGRAAETGGTEPGPESDYLVLLPPLAEAGERTVQLATRVNQFPGGREPCCGETRYGLETFRLLPVDPPNREF